VKRLVLFLFITFVSEPSYSKIKVGEAPPDYLGVDSSGQEIRISDFRGKVVVATFWATWCPPCMQELPILELAQRQEMNRLKVIAVNYKERERTFKKFREKTSDYQMVFTRGSRKIIRSYKVKALPYMVIVGKDGAVAYINKGYDKKMIPKLVDQLNSEITKEFDSQVSEVPASEAAF